MNRLLNKTAVITGGNSGIGLATATEFIAEGAKVLITGRDEHSLNNALEALGKNAGGIISDSSDLKAIRGLSKQVSATFPAIDILFINAGMAKFAPFEEITEAQFDEQFNTNVKGAYFTIQQLLPLMKVGGSIILMGSINAHIGRPNASVYSATKGALLTLARTLSSELLPRTIRVNTVSPGPVATGFRSKLGLPVDKLQQMEHDTITSMPIGRLGTPAEIAKIAVFLGSDDSTFVLGTELIADGGFGIL